MSLGYPSFFRNDPFFYDPFSSFNSSLFDPFFTSDTPMLTANTNTGNTNNNQQQLQSTSNSNSSDTRVGHHGKNRRHHGGLSLFSPVIAARNMPMPDMTVDMFTSPTAYDVHAHCAGIDKKDINITIEGNVLNIQAERKQVKKESSKSPSSKAQITEEKTNTPSSAQQESKTASSSSPGSTGNNTSTNSNKKSNADMSDSDEGHYSYIESVYGQVQRSFTLPEDVDAGGLSAKYEDGVIKIHIPRIPQQKAQRQRISLQ